MKITSAYCLIFLFLFGFQSSFAYDSETTDPGYGSPFDAAQDGDIACLDLPISGKRPVQFAGGSPTKIPTSFLLERVRPTRSETQNGVRKKHFAHIAIDFQQASDYGQGAFTEKKKKYLAVVQTCLDRVQSQLRDKNGSAIELRVYDENNRDHRDLGSAPKGQPKPVVINIGGEGKTPYMSDWPKDLVDYGDNDTVFQKRQAERACPTIAHEMLHHLGLCDEYKSYNPLVNSSPGGGHGTDSVRKQLGNFQAPSVSYNDLKQADLLPESLLYQADCRAIGHSTSPLRVWENVFTKDPVAVGVQYCECPPGEQCGIPRSHIDRTIAAVENENLNYQPSCPTGYRIARQNGTYKRVFSKKAFSEFINHKDNFTGQKTTLALRSIEARQPPAFVMQPAHMRAIVYAGCQEKNSLYYSCSQGAYRSSKEPSGCPQMNSQCRKRGQWIQ